MEQAIIRAREFRAGRAWGALDIAQIEGASVRLHWTDQPYRWHVNDGAEVFALLDGMVDMHYKIDGTVQVAHLAAGELKYRESIVDGLDNAPRGLMALLKGENFGKQLVRLG